jgi:hypothetical protein
MTFQENLYIVNYNLFVTINFIYDIIQIVNNKLNNLLSKKGYYFFKSTDFY